jgi:TolB-like protein
MITRFLREMKRRRVLNTAWLYVAGAWIALQVVEVLSGAGLPPETMRRLLVILSIGFPLALTAGWFFDISRDGITRTCPLPPGEELPRLKFMDHVLLAGLLAVAVVDAWILNLPVTDQAASPEVLKTPQQRTIAVLAFEDIRRTTDEDRIGETLADELRSSLTRIPGIRVLGPETSRALNGAGARRMSIAQELLVTAILLGEVLLDGDRMQLKARLITVPGGKELWAADVERAVGDAIELQNRFIQQIVANIAPGLDPNPHQGYRAGAGECSEVYDTYLRGRQLSKARRKSQAEQYQRGMELLRETVAIDKRCALAWEAIAIGELEWTTPGLAKAGAAARRALELNDALPEAWVVLAEIAEQEEDWDRSEEHLLRALYSDPTNVRANFFYSEALIARGRVRDALHYALEAYRYEPVSGNVNFRVMLAAFYAGENDLIFQHAEIFKDIEGADHPWVVDMVAEAQLRQGNVDVALETWSRSGDVFPDWFFNCARVRQNPKLAPAVKVAAQQTLEQILAGSLEPSLTFDFSWNVIRCGIWLGEPDLVFRTLEARTIPGWESGIPTEVLFVNMFHSDGAVLRQDSRFRQMVLDSGLLDYWKKWGWADMCRPSGDSFECN